MDLINYITNSLLLFDEDDDHQISNKWTPEGFQFYLLYLSFFISVVSTVVYVVFFEDDSQLVIGLDEIQVLQNDEAYNFSLPDTSGSVYPDISSAVKLLLVLIRKTCSIFWDIIEYILEVISSFTNTTLKSLRRLKPQKPCVKFGVIRSANRTSASPVPLECQQIDQRRSVPKEQVILFNNTHKSIRKRLDYLNQETISPSELTLLEHSKEWPKYSKQMVCDNQPANLSKFSKVENPIQSSKNKIVATPPRDLSRLFAISGKKSGGGYNYKNKTLNPAIVMTPPAVDEYDSVPEVQTPLLEARQTLCKMKCLLERSKPPAKFEPGSRRQEALWSDTLICSRPSDAVTYQSLLHDQEAYHNTHAVKDGNLISAIQKCKCPTMTPLKKDGREGRQTRNRYMSPISEISRESSSSASECLDQEVKTPRK